MTGKIQAIRPWQRIWAFIIAMAVAITLIPGGFARPVDVRAAEMTWDLSSQGVLSIPSGSTDDYTVTGSYTGTTTGITVPNNYQGTITLNNVSVNTSSSASVPAMLLNGSGSLASPTTYATVVLVGSNTLTSGYERAGLEVWMGATVCIEGSGSLHARCGTTITKGNGSGIGAGDVRGSGGNVVIKSGTVTGTAGYHGAGIGGAWSREADDPQYSAPYRGIILIYGGDVVSAGGQHGAGIGGGCRGGNGTIVVLPPANISATSVGGHGALGKMDNIVYIGDPGQPQITVRTQNTDKNADIYIDVTNIAVIQSALALVPDLDASHLFLGNTGSTGTMTTYGTFNQQVAFSTDTLTPKGNSYMPVETTASAATNVVLPYPYMPSITASPASNTALNYDYTSAQATAAAAGKIIIKNDGAAVLDNFTLDLTDAGNADFTLTPVASANSTTTRLVPGGTITYTCTLKQGKVGGTYTGKVSVTGKTEASGTQTASASVIQQVTQLSTGTHGDISVTAAPPSGSITSVTGPVIMGLTINAKHTLKPGGAQYLVTNGNTVPGDGAWIAFANGDAVTFPGTGTNWYIHWRVETDNILSKSTTASSFGPYSVDMVRPTVTSITTTDTVVNASPFTATIVFDKPVDSTALLAGIQVTNGAASGLTADTSSGSGGYYTTYTVTITPSTGVPSGSSIDIKVLENAAKDISGNGNTASTASVLNSGNGITLNSDDPLISAWSVNPHGYIYTTAAPSSLTTTVRSNGKNGSSADAGLYIGGTRITSANAETVAAPLFDLQQNGSSVSFTVGFTATSDGGVFTLTPSTALGDDSAYKITVTAGLLENRNSNSMAGATRSFEVRVPTVTGGSLSVSPNTLTQTGGQATVTITGRNLTGVLDLEEAQPDGSKVIRQVSVNPAGTQAAYTATLSPNYDNTLKTYTFASRLNAVNTGDTGSVTVAAAAPLLTSGSGLSASPDQLGYAGGQTTLTLNGENLNNFTALVIEETNDLDGTVRTFPITGLSQSASVAAQSVTIAPNTNENPVVYTYTAKNAGTAIPNGTATVTVAEATPGVGDGSGSALTVTPDQLTNAGGTVTMVLKGTNLHNFDPLEIRDDQGTVYPIALADISSDSSTATITAALAPNLGRNDLAYTFTLYSAIRGSGNPAAAQTAHTAQVTVEGSTPQITSADAAPPMHTSGGGTSVITITGRYLENALPLELRDNARGAVYAVTSPTATGSTQAAISLGFSKDMSEHRNTIYELEVYSENLPTGVIATVEVGDSVPRLTGFDARPATFTQAETKTGKGKSELTVHGDYLYNYWIQNGEKLEIYDVINKAWHKVSTSAPSDDRTAAYTMTIPSNKGIYTYELYLDGVYTGYEAQVAVGVSLGYSVPDPSADEPDKGKDPSDKEWTGRGGGEKGGQWSGGWNYTALDILYYHAKAAVKTDPDNSVMTLQNVWYIIQYQIDRAASGARADNNKATVTIHLDTMDPNDASLVEGRLYFKAENGRFVNGKLYPMVFTRAQMTQATKQLFDSTFGNSNFEVVRLSQVGSYGIRVEIAANAKLSGFDTDNLHFYLYIPETGEYTAMSNPDYFIDSEGYLHFFTDEGGDVVITDKALSSSSGTLEAVIKTGREEERDIDVERNTPDRKDNEDTAPDRKDNEDTTPDRKDDIDEAKLAEEK